MVGAIAAMAEPPQIPVPAEIKLESFQLSPNARPIRYPPPKQVKSVKTITAKDISENLLKQHNIEIDKRKLVLADNIKTFGTYEIDAKVYPEISGKLKVKVCE